MRSPIGSHEIPIDDILEKAYDKLEIAFKMGVHPNANIKSSFPMVGEVACPGSGKTFSIQTLAADQKILESWWKKKQIWLQSTDNDEIKNPQLAKEFYEKMKNALRIVVTYNNFSKPTYIDEGNVTNIGMCCRILYRFVFMVIFFKKTHLMKNKYM